MPIVSGRGFGKSFMPERIHLLSGSLMLAHKAFNQIALGLGLLVALASTGCSMFPASTTDILPAQTGPSRGKYQVVIQSNFGESTSYDGEIVGNMTVTSALHRSNAVNKFRGMDIVLHRVVEGSGQPLKLPVAYVYRDRSAVPEQDYALLPNDRIYVSSKSSNTLDKFVDSLIPGN